jgi:glycosyltransferase involved in cell wall biosynthesis
MTSPKVSVLIPTYNYVRYLPEAIESVLEQDWRDLELLISDDGSTDGSREVIARYAAQDSRIRFQIHPTNLGMVRNWNWCLSEARGEYIKFLFGDDKLASRQALGKLLQVLETNASVALTASARYVIGENSEVLETWDDFRTPGVHNGREVIARCLEENRNLIGEPSAVLFRRRDAARGFNLSYRQIVDLEMWFHLLEKGSFAYTREPLCYFRKHAQQQTEVNKAGQTGEKEALRLFREFRVKPYLEPGRLSACRFSTLYRLRKQRKRGAHVPQEMLQAERDLSAQINRFWYAAWWLRRRITRPFQNLYQWAERRSHRATLGRVAPSPDPRKKLLFLSHDASRTGAPLLLLECVRWLRQNTDLPFRILLRVGGPLEKDFRALGETCLADHTRLDAAFFADVALIYSNTCTNGDFLNALPRGDIPVVTHIHELQPSIDSLTGDKLQAIKQHTQGFIACSDAVARDLREAYQVPADRISRIYGGVPVELVLQRASEIGPDQVRRELGVSQDTFVVGACGTEVWHKGPDLFIQVARHFKQHAPGGKFIFLWIGWTPNDTLTHVLRREIALFGLEDCVRFLGERENPYPFLNACDVFCLPSRLDSFPLAMLEAAALGKPVVCFTQSGGAAEFCALGAGFTEPYPDTKAMGQRCLDLMANSNLRRESGAKAARLVRERFDIRLTGSQVWEAIRPFINSQNSSGRGEIL